MKKKADAPELFLHSYSSFSICDNVGREFVVIMRWNTDFKPRRRPAITARDDLADLVQSRNHRRLFVRHAQYQKLALRPQLRSDFRQQCLNAFAGRGRNCDGVRMAFPQTVQWRRPPRSRRG